MTDVTVACRAQGGAWSCAVTVRDDRSATQHEVRVASADLARYAAGATEPTDLVRRSITFLLDREPKESILRSFDLRVIARYFPEWEREITDAGD